jgi:hypothetical protein
MPRTTHNLNTCGFRTFGGVCQMKCFGERCSRHRNRRILTVCTHCMIEDNVTSSVTGICGSEKTGCKTKRQLALQKAKRIRDKARLKELEERVVQLTIKADNGALWRQEPPNEATAGGCQAQQTRSVGGSMPTGK